VPEEQDVLVLRRSIVELQAQLVALTCYVATIPHTVPLQDVRNLLNVTVDKTTDASSQRTAQAVKAAAHKYVDYIDTLHGVAVGPKD